MRDDIDQFLNRLVHAGSWWELAAFDLYRKAHVQFIPSRDGTSLYLARFWLTQPRPSSDDGSPFDSAESTLLHYFARGDDDQALHDHPWDFTTTVLEGGYTERRPAVNRYPPIGAQPHGPHFDDCYTITRRAGHARAERRASDLHAVEDVLPGTWTLVTTGPRVRSWGFHPPGKSWTPWRDFITAKRAGAGIA